MYFSASLWHMTKVSNILKIKLIISNSFNSWKSTCISYFTSDNGTSVAIKKVPVDNIAQAI